MADLADKAALAAPVGPSLTVIVPTYRRPERLARLLAALSPQVAGHPDRGIVVVNDGSHDPAYERAVAEHRDTIDYLALPENRGQSAARNEGARRSHRQFLVFTDDDCVPPPYWLDWLSALLSANPDADAVGGATLPFIGPENGLLTRFLVRRGYTPRVELHRGTAQLLVTANLAVRRQTFAAVGGFDERLRSSEDRNLTRRLRKAGAVLCLDRTWYVFHDLDHTLVEHLRRYFRYGYWRPVGDVFSPTVPEPLPLPGPGWRRWAAAALRSPAYHWRRNRTRGVGWPTRLAFTLLGLMTEAAFRLGILSGRRAAARLRPGATR